MKTLSAIALLAGLAACSGGGTDDTATANDAAPAATPAEATVAYASLTGNAGKGETLFLQCRACHTIEAGRNLLGPSLHGVVGRTAGQVPGFAYSAANKASGIVWSEAEIFAFLESPQKTLPGTRMSYFGMKAPQDRADLIAYLRTLS